MPPRLRSPGLPRAHGWGRRVAPEQCPCRTLGRVRTLHCVAASPRGGVRRADTRARCPSSSAVCTKTVVCKHWPESRAPLGDDRDGTRVRRNRCDIRPHHAKSPKKFISSSGRAFLRSRRLEIYLPGAAPDWRCAPAERDFGSSHISDSGTRRRIQSVTSAGRIPTKNT